MLPIHRYASPNKKERVTDSKFSIDLTRFLIFFVNFSEETYLVFDYCQRSMLTVSSGDVIPQLPTKEMLSAGKHLMLMTLLENYDGKTIEMVSFLERRPIHNLI